MRNVAMLSALLMGVALPAFAADEKIHAPTNRMDQAVPEMKAPNNKTTTDANKSGAAANNKGETVHAPTNRMGAEVPPMKSGDSKTE